MKTLVVYNPTSEEELIDEVRTALDAYDPQSKWIETTEDDPGVGQARTGAEASAEVVVAVGGDGTVRACAEGLVDSNTALGIIPAGTGNLLARNLGIPMTIPEAVEAALSGRHVRIDTGLVEHETFVVMAGAGLDALIMERTESDAKERFGSLAYVIEAARSLDSPSVPAQIFVDGKSLGDERWAAVLVGNFGRLQAGVELFPESSATDGRLEVLGVSADSAPSRIKAAVKAVTNGEGERLFRAAGKMIEFVFGEPSPYELDGEARQPVDSLLFEVVPASLNVRVPEPN